MWMFFFWISSSVRLVCVLGIFVGFVLVVGLVSFGGGGVVVLGYRGVFIYVYIVFLKVKNSIN